MDLDFLSCFKIIRCYKNSKRNLKQYEKSSNTTLKLDLKYSIKIPFSPNLIWVICGLQITYHYETSIIVKIYINVVSFKCYLVNFNM